MMTCNERHACHHADPWAVMAGYDMKNRARLTNSMPTTSTASIGRLMATPLASRGRRKERCGLGSGSGQKLHRSGWPCFATSPQELSRPEFCAAPNRQNTQKMSPGGQLTSEDWALDAPYLFPLR